MGMLIILFVLVVSWVYAYVKTYHIVHFIFFHIVPFKYVQCIVCQVYLKKAVKNKI